MKKKWHHRLHEVVFESHTASGRIFDFVLLVAILSSVVIVMLDSVQSLHLKYSTAFHRAEWAFTILFSIEYLLRIILTKYPFRFIFSFLGIIDLVAILPTYVSLLIGGGAQTLLMLRALRLLRIFRIFRLSHFLLDLKYLSGALKNSFRKITIFFLFEFVVIIIMGSMMYLIENPNGGFTSIPQSIYWAINTITSVGSGDMVPITSLGKVVASIVMLIGYATIAVPMGIITTEMALAMKSLDTGHEICKTCHKGGHDHDALHCKHCGAKFETETVQQKHSDHQTNQDST
jgi:voltage-gated potassium channel